MTLPLRYTQVSSHLSSLSSNVVGRRRILPSAQALILRSLPSSISGSYSIPFPVERGKIFLNGEDLPISPFELIWSAISFASVGTLSISGRDVFLACRASLLFRSPVNL